MFARKPTRVFILTYKVWMLPIRKEPASHPLRGGVISISKRHKVPPPGRRGVHTMELALILS